MPGFDLALARLLVMADHFLDHEPDEFLAKLGVEVGLLRQLAQARNLRLLAPRIGRGQGIGRLVGTHSLSDPEPFRQHMDQRRVDVVDTAAERGELLVGCGLGHHGHAYHGGGPVSKRSRASDSPRLPSAAHGRMAAGMTADIVPLPRKRPTLDPMLALTAQGMNSVNAVILDRMQSEIPLIPALAGHLISGGGKRLRPMLTLAGAELVGYQGTRHHKLAAAVEFIHTATLLHDDVVDGSELRRGKAAANIIFGNPATVLVGDFLFSRAFELMTEDGSLKVLKILANASAVIAEGEVSQLTAQRQIGTSEEQYLHIIGAKTAALFAAASRISAVVAECDDAQERALEAYGRNLGVAFQLVDDAIDYDSDAAEMGKDQGDDFREGKMTLPVILAYARGTEEERKFWQLAIAGHRSSDEDLAEAIRLIGKYDAVETTRERARHFAERAINAISIFPDSKARAAMAEAAQFAVARGY